MGAKGRASAANTPKICSIEGCGRPNRGRGYCGAHRYRLRKGLDMLPPINTNNSRPGGARKRPTFEWSPWKINSNGYLISHRSVGGSGTEVRLQHRVVMEEYLGRKLVKGENVHHINGVRNDNRIENLELWNTSQPPGQRIQDKVAWAVDMLGLYAPEMLN